MNIEHKKQGGRKQAGASKISNILWLAILGFGVYLGIQYVPHFLEIKTLDSVLDSLVNGQMSNPAASAQEVTSRITSQLNINQKDNLRSAFKVREDGRNITVTAIYDWELNLLYEKKPMHFERSVNLE